MRWNPTPYPSHALLLFTFTKRVVKSTQIDWFQSVSRWTTQGWDCRSCNVNHYTYTKTSLRTVYVLLIHPWLHPTLVERFRQDGCRCLPYRQAPLLRSEANEQTCGEPDKSWSSEKRVLQKLRLSAPGTEWVPELTATMTATFQCQATGRWVRRELATTTNEIVLVKTAQPIHFTG